MKKKKDILVDDDQVVKNILTDIKTISDILQRHDQSIVDQKLIVNEHLKLFNTVLTNLIKDQEEFKKLKNFCYKLRFASIIGFSITFLILLYLLI